MAATPTSRRRNPPVGMQPLSPQRKWRAIMVATLVLVPAFWALLAGLVGERRRRPRGTEAAPNAAVALAVGLAVIPFVFIVLAFMSEHPRAPGAVLRAMGWALLVGIPVSALAGDAVTGIVAGVGAGGIQALRMDDPQNWRARAWRGGGGGVHVRAGAHSPAPWCCCRRPSSRSRPSASPITSPSAGPSRRRSADPEHVGDVHADPAAPRGPTAKTSTLRPEPDAMGVDSAGCSDSATSRPPDASDPRNRPSLHAERRTTSSVSSVTPRGEASPSS